MIWHTGLKEDVLTELKTDRTAGLTTKEAQARQAEYGKNALREKPRRNFLQRFLNQMQDTMVIILLIATLISLTVCIYNALRGFEAEWAEPIVIVGIVILNAIMGVVQESRADAALEALKTMSAPNAKVWRDGVLTTVSSTALVPGDIITFEAGDMIPADCRLLECARLYCDESALTGESLPVEKDAAAEIASTMSLGDRVNMVYSGCAVSNGNGTAVVVATGMSTEMGRIAAMLGNEEDTATPLQRKLAQLGKQLGFLALAICIVIFIIGIFGGLKPLEIFMTAVSLAVAAIPEGLLAIVTVVLAMGVQRMVKQKALIRRLPAVETLGSASVVCSDKTGTLTQNRMTLVRAFMGGHMEDLRQEPSEAALTLIRLATLCTDGSVQVTENGVEQHIGDPTETAIIAYALHNGIEKEDLFAQCPRVDEIPFDSERKLMTSVHFIDGETIAIVKGAPEILLSRCKHGDVEAALQANEAMGKSALRVLAVACRKLRKKDAHEEDVMENELTLLGLLGMMDPPRTEAVAAIRECRAAGIRPIMITGDHVVTASAIATQMGILTEDTKAITGAELAEMSDKDLKKHIAEYSVYARVTPADKIRIVKAWKKRGEVVAMTGDGVNDAPALKAADIGCAMGITGTDVAKGASDIVLLDDNFATIVAAVKEGRGIYDNIRKAVHFLLSCNLGEVLAVLFAMIFWRETPFAPMQLLWINLVTDSLPALALGMEPAEADIMTRKPRSRKESLFAGTVGQQAVWQGAMIAALSLLAYYIGSRVLPGAHVVLGETMAFATMAFAQMVHAFNVRSSHSLFEVGFFSNRYMGGAFLASLA
ncbi:MAG: calcium-translocating P-type ATPase, PMCA-type, partial [Clostridia bacterium]|nr:calcium-translocating P-type ATPase, PMCA-type [Clostridia bacterium]